MVQRGKVDPRFVGDTGHLSFSLRVLDVGHRNPLPKPVEPFLRAFMRRDHVVDRRFRNAPTYSDRHQLAKSPRPGPFAARLARQPRGL